MHKTEYHIVHIESIQKVANREKPAEIEEWRKAQSILRRLREDHRDLNIVYVDHPSRLDHVPAKGVSVIIGGAFDGQCLADYEKTLENNGISFSRDENLILR